MNHQIISISQLIFENLFAKRYSYVLFCVRLQIIIFDQQLLLLLVWGGRLDRKNLLNRENRVFKKISRLLILVLVLTEVTMKCRPAPVLKLCQSPLPGHCCNSGIIRGTSPRCFPYTTVCQLTHQL